MSTSFYVICHKCKTIDHIASYYASNGWSYFTDENDENILCKLHKTHNNCICSGDLIFATENMADDYIHEYCQSRKD